MEGAQRQLQVREESPAASTVPLLLARREELRGGRCLVVSQAEQGRAQISRVPSDSGVAGTLRGSSWQEKC